MLEKSVGEEPCGDVLYRGVLQRTVGEERWRRVL